MQVFIEDIVGAMDWSGPGGAYLNMETGAILTINVDLERAYRKFEDLPEGASDEEVYAAFGWGWEYPEFLNFLRNGDQYKRLPDQYEIREYRLIQRFISTVEDNECREELQRAIRGKGAYRKFKETLYRYGIQRQWYEVKDQHLMSLAQEWCANNNISYTHLQP